MADKNRKYNYSYGQLINDRNSFVQVDKTGANRFDIPGAVYFKILFYFSDENGLLGIENIGTDPTQEKSVTDLKAPFKTPDADDSIVLSARNFKNTAYNFLLLNDELERAEYLRRFVLLLSEISANSPWYFSELSGIDTALERKTFSEGEMKVEDKPAQISIKCLPDAYDNRIATLLELYRAACFSFQNNKEIVPRNLRKFNMGILFFNAPIRGNGGKSGDSENEIKIPDSNETMYIPSAKLIEFQNCEIDYNSSKSGYSEFKTEEPAQMSFTINISYDMCYESRYNEFMQQVITDFVNIDINKARIGAALDNISKHGKSMEDNTSLRIHGGRSYWTNTNRTDSDPYSVPSEKVQYTANENYRRRGGILASQISQAADKISDMFSLPTIDLLKENIHDNGTINAIGKYEYLNRMSNSNGLAGQLTQQAAGLAVKGVTDTVKKMYLGNIYGFSMSDLANTINMAASGDATGLYGKYGEKSTRTAEFSGKDKLTGYDNEPEEKPQLTGKLWNAEKVAKLNKINTKKSIFNSL